MLLLLKRSWERVEVERQDADSTLFLGLMYLAEALTKLTTAFFVAALEEDTQRSRYRHLHRLVRADGIGEWVQVLDDVLAGPSAVQLAKEVWPEQRELTERVGEGAWQFEAVSHLERALAIAGSAVDRPASKIDGRRIFSLIAALRNKTRGHGATLGKTYSALCPPLEAALRLCSENLAVLKCQWAYLHQNLSGKYRVTGLTQDVSAFEKLRSTPPGSPLANGVYFHKGRHIRVDLVESDVDASDFFFPNGHFTGRTYESLSYITDTRRQGDGSPYMVPAVQLPGSETDGRNELDLIGNTFANLPAHTEAYISRPALEAELLDLLRDDRHPVITLLGRGGIGKTSLALAVLYTLAETSHFQAIVWLSARDVDLLPHGPKVVKPQVLSVADMSREFARLMNPHQRSDKGFEVDRYFADCLTKSPLGKPILFVFDNFETVRNPVELFQWISTYIRLPNKSLITTRTRDFKADYPLEVKGMTEEESDELITSTARRLGVDAIVDLQYRRELYSEADGHPYVLKILLGEVAKARAKVKVERLVARKDEILDALFERTYGALPVAAQRVFLTLCAWRSIVPELALEAVLTAGTTEAIDVPAAIEELLRWSLVEAAISDKDDERFLSTPLTAAAFGRGKLAVSPMKLAVEADLRILQQMGALQVSQIRHGVAGPIDRLVRGVCEQIARDSSGSKLYIAIVEYIASRYPKAWLTLSMLREELGQTPDATRAMERFLQSDKIDSREKATAWDRLSVLYGKQQDHLGEINALVERSQLDCVSLGEISSIAGRLNAALRTAHLEHDERRMVVRKLIDAFEARMKTFQADATDLSRLAWLYLRLNDENRARQIAERGLELDPENDHCLRLIERLSMP